MLVNVIAHTESFHRLFVKFVGILVIRMERTSESQGMDSNPIRHRLREAIAIRVEFHIYAVSVLRMLFVTTPLADAFGTEHHTVHIGQTAPRSLDFSDTVPLSYHAQ